ncbi:MAG: exodeoxyribonuclease V subunit alpha [Ginsengibacter sp.]
MKITNDVHQQFAEYFPSENAKPYLYLLSKKLSDGHICIHINEIENEELPEGYTFNSKLIERDSLVSNGDEKKPLILQNNRLYLQRYFHYETIILNRIKKFIEDEKSQSGMNLDSLKNLRDVITGLFKNSNTDSGNKNENINWQLVAVITAILNNFTIITGGPGTGKTTTVAKILSLLFTMNPGLKVALAEPTGKAAARMGESLKNASAGGSEIMKTKFETMEPLTIHRLLGWQKDSIYFKQNKENTLPYDLIIVDESSMIDVALFAKLLEAIGPKTKLILLGDKDQLASVEAGSLFGDLCQAQSTLNTFSEEKAAWINSFINDKTQTLNQDFISHSTHPLFEHIIELKKSHRFSDDKGIGKFSKAIIKNNEEVLREFFRNADEQVLVDKDYTEKIFNEFVDGYGDYIKETNIAEALKKMNRLKMLCAVREGEQGLYAINKKIEKHLQQKKLIKVTGEFYENRPVMITGNNYELNLFNGDVGIVRADEKGILQVWFEVKGEIKPVLPAFVSNAETAYAMTIHKSQGSEFNEVMVVLPHKEDVQILTRELLYTAVTRAKNKVVVQASEAMILQTSHASVKRGSGIKERFIN